MGGQLREVILYIHSSVFFGKPCIMPICDHLGNYLLFMPQHFGSVVVI